MRIRSTLVKFLLYLDFGITLIAASLFLVQGGFWGGGKNSDTVLLALAMPWVLVPLPDMLYEHDFLWLVLAPFVLNSAVVACIAWAIGARRHVADGDT